MWTFAVAVGVILAMDRREYVLAGVLFVAGGALVEYWWPGVLLVIAAYRTFRDPVGLGPAWLVGALVLLGTVNGNAWAVLAAPLMLGVACWSSHVRRVGGSSGGSIRRT